MKEVRLKFENCEFANLDEMAATLLNEANERIVLIDLGEIENTREERNYVKFRLMHLERSFRGEIYEGYRSIYNSLWSQLYRLEHQGNDSNPYLKNLLERLRSAVF
ncbi:hypothetical protein [Robertmurraya andreesenii]|uniref:Helix-turn-helix protein n=1 Tax=Anoxybacillus andreesenii TaxID=1325932 RepID=A0ABT9V3Z1_9BACL|nr:hypothetical protein [Robertmurraya andreesenii]MDQ0155664.1 helix-turn-helix protein [Robertmurraya andreesenii]